MNLEFLLKCYTWCNLKTVKKKVIWCTVFSFENDSTKRVFRIEVFLFKLSSVSNCQVCLISKYLYCVETLVPGKTSSVKAKGHHSFQKNDFLAIQNVMIKY